MEGRGWAGPGQYQKENKEKLQRRGSRFLEHCDKYDVGQGEKVIGSVMNGRNMETETRGKERKISLREPSCFRVCEGGMGGLRGAERKSRCVDKDENPPLPLERRMN